MTVSAFSVVSDI